jgi:ATP-binding cassette subfamily B protein
MDYVRLVAASDRTAKEVQLFGLAPWLIARYSILARRFVKVSTSLAFRRTLIGSGVSFVSAFAYYGAYVSVLSRALTGAISVGTLTFLAASFRQCRDGVQNLLSSVSSLYEQSLYLKDLWAFLDLRPAIGNAAHACPMPKKIQSGFVFEDVGFRYPGSDRWALRHIKFKLRCGERVALVGENGAGKTTLTKLIARLYDPTEGRILLDGVDLREYAITEVRRAIGVIFQDFVRYDMRFDENVGVGEVEPVRAYLDADETAQGLPLPIAISAAVDMALAASLPRRWPAGYRQMLGRRFEGGVELSGGEWQKVALARAYMRDAQVVILDEPTASLDARAEYEVFGRFNALMAGRTAIVISHRFSTVRVADRIVVLAGGRIVEEGPHETLVSANGVYADLFTLQAAAYK